jgi:hypothetical protein
MDRLVFSLFERMSYTFEIPIRLMISVFVLNTYLHTSYIYIPDNCHRPAPSGVPLL